MTAINFTANPITSQKLVAQKLARLQEYKISKSIVKDNAQKLQQNNSGKLPITNLQNIGSQKTVEEKAVIDDFLINLEEQIALEPKNVELRKAYETFKSNLQG